jgi:Fe-S cluster assembly protein SufD
MSTTQVANSALPTNYLMPTGREEAWRFTPMNRVKSLLDSQTKFSPYFIDGCIEFQGEKTLPEWATLTQESITAISDSSDESVLNLRSVQAVGSVLNIASNQEVETPLYIKRVINSADFAARLLVKIGKFSRLTIVIENNGSGNLLDEVEYLVEDGAQLTVVHLHEWSSEAIHLGHIHAKIGRDATFRSHIVSVGGGVVRILPTVDFAGPGASAELNGVYFATEGQHLEHRIHVDHNIPKAKSRVNYKGALAGESARTVWIGDVYIHAGATDTDTYELNRNLLLTDGARADSVPNLEIETGEIVGAGHASTTGRFDDEQLFYLMSRGIPMDLARKLVIRGYFGEIISLIGIEEIQDRISNRIESELEKVGI